MTTADDLRDLRDALDSIAHGALPRWGKPTTKTGEEAQVAAREMYSRFVRALLAETGGKMAMTRAQEHEDNHRTHAEILTECAERLERERDELRSKLAGEAAHIKSLEGLLVDAIRERDEARAEVERLRAALEETEHAMHLRIRAGYDKTIADAWRAKVAEVEEQRNANAREIDTLRAERRQLRHRVVECLRWVGRTPYPNTPGFDEMIAVRDLAADTLEEVKP